MKAIHAAVVVFLLLAMALVSTASSSGAPAASVRLAATLTAKAETSPVSRAARAGGRFTATLGAPANGRSRLRWTLTYTRLTGKPIAAHIHLGPPGKAGAVLVTLCAPGCGRVSVQGVSLLRAAQRRSVLAGRTYVNLHTRRNPAGEIRGQLKRVR